MEECCQEVPTGSRRRTMCERARVERSNLGNFSTMWRQKSKPERSVLRSTRKLCCALKKAWDLYKNICNVKGTSVQACEKTSDLPTGQLKRKLSHLVQIANMKIDDLLWTAEHFLTRVRMNSLLVKRYRHKIERSHRHHGCQRKGRVDGRRDSEL